jgi:hypothetical protein
MICSKVDTCLTHVIMPIQLLRKKRKKIGLINICLNIGLCLSGHEDHFLNLFPCFDNDQLKGQKSKHDFHRSTLATSTHVCPINKLINFEIPFQQMTYYQIFHQILYFPLGKK